MGDMTRLLWPLSPASSLRLRDDAVMPSLRDFMCYVTPCGTLPRPGSRRVYPASVPPASTPASGKQKLSTYTKSQFSLSVSHLQQRPSARSAKQASGGLQASGQLGGQSGSHTWHQSGSTGPHTDSPRAASAEAASAGAAASPEQEHRATTRSTQLNFDMRGM